jgi:hypothetical protein
MSKKKLLIVAGVAAAILGAYLYGRHRDAKKIQKSISDMTNPNRPTRTTVAVGQWGI